MCTESYEVFACKVCQCPTLSHAVSDILTLALNKTMIDGDKTKQDGVGQI